MTLRGLLCIQNIDIKKRLSLKRFPFVACGLAGQDNIKEKLC